MRYVYLLSDHDEGGSDNVVATLDREALPALVDVQMALRKPSSGMWIEGYKEQVKASLFDLLKRSNDELATEQKHCLTRGWGVMQLHVVRLGQD